MEKLNFLPLLSQMAIIGAIVVFMILFGLYILGIRRRKLAEIRFKLAIAILEKDLYKFFEFIKETPADVFEDVSLQFLSVEFLTDKISTKNFYQVVKIYKELGGDGRSEARRIFERAFANQKPEFWATNYVYDFIHNESKRSKQFEEFFELFHQESFTKLYREISDQFNNFIDFDIAKELKEKLQLENKRIKVLLG